MSFHHLVSCPGADEGKALPLSNPVRNQGCQSVQKHVATRYTPYHPWDDCIFTFIWLIFYGKCSKYTSPMDGMSTNSVMNIFGMTSTRMSELVRSLGS